MSQADWDRVQYYSRKVKSFIFNDDASYSFIRVHQSTYFRFAQLLQSNSLFPSLRHLKFDRYSSGDITHIFLFLSPLLNSLEFININEIEHTIIGPFLATLSSQILHRIILRNGKMSANILESSIIHLKQLRSLELSDAVYMRDFTLWEMLGALPFLANLTLKATDPKSHPAHAPEESNSQSGVPKYFYALENLCVTGSFFFIQHLLGFIDSPCLTTIKVYPVVNRHGHETDNHFTPSMTIIASKWSQSLKNLVIDSSSSSTAQRYATISQYLMLLTDLHEMQSFHTTWRMKNMDDDVRRLVMSWPKLRSLKLHLDSTVAFISFATLRIIAENCPDLRYLQIPLNHDTSTSVIPSFDPSSKSLHHNLEVLDILVVGSETTITSTSHYQWLLCQMEVSKYLDFIFPYLTDIEVGSNETWLGIRDLIMLCQGASLRRVK